VGLQTAAGNDTTWLGGRGGEDRGEFTDSALKCVMF